MLPYGILLGFLLASNSTVLRARLSDKNRYTAEQSDISVSGLTVLSVILAIYVTNITQGFYFALSIIAGYLLHNLYIYSVGRNFVDTNRIVGVYAAWPAAITVVCLFLSLNWKRAKFYFGNWGTTMPNDVFVILSLVVILIFSNYLVQRFNKKRRVMSALALYFALLHQGATVDDAVGYVCYKRQITKDEIELIIKLGGELEQEAANYKFASDVEKKVFG